MSGKRDVAHERQTRCGGTQLATRHHRRYLLPLWISVWKVATLYGKPLRILDKLQEGLTMENGPIFIEDFQGNFNRSLYGKSLWNISRGS
eukprot:364943-Chlamydomonas_euryale.AAC.27